jgi:hypothetical protein
MDLEEADDHEEGRGTNPRCPSRLQWPSFYLTHKEDLDKLWDKGVEILFGSEVSDFSEADVVDVDDAENIDEDDEDEDDEK